VNVQDETRPIPQWDGTTRSVLDRRINLTTIPLELVGWIAIFAIGIGVRLIGRTNWPLSRDEAVIALDAQNWALGNEVSDAALVQPALVQLTAVMFFLFGDTDYVARLLPLLASIGTLAIVFAMRGLIGMMPAFGISSIWAISPVMMFSSNRLDGGAILVFCAFLALAAVLTLSHRGSTIAAALLGMSLGLAVTVHPLGWIVLIATAVPAAVLLRDEIRMREVLASGIGLALTVVLSATWLMTRPTAILDYLGNVFQSLWNEELSPIGGELSIAVVVLLADEPLSVLLVITAVAMFGMNAFNGSRLTQVLIIAVSGWSVPLLAVGLLSGSTNLVRHTVLMLPLIVLAGFGLAALLQHLREHATGTRTLTLAILTAAGFLIALGRLLGHFFAGPGTELANWLGNVVALGFLVMLPLGYFAVLFLIRLGRSAVPAALIAIALLLGLLGLRTGLLLNDTSANRPGEALVAGSTSPSVGIVERRLHRYSRDATTYAQDARTPEGGYGLVIAIDSLVEQPFDWYFRRFPERFSVAGPDALDPQSQPDVLIAPRERAEEYETILDGYRRVDYGFTLGLLDAVADSNAGETLLWLANPGGGRSYVNFLVFRDSGEPRDRDHFTLFLSEAHANPFWGPEP
jgi:hypothetical protein